ncbi:LOW QUALITY PROTEIN: two-component sensor histidine kinase [Bacillus sp. JCM 19047]|nr:LOW QUALITY PROTEIN: two-component sensor histidine kinase [Bacillus sp. JCM 19047]
MERGGGSVINKGRQYPMREKRMTIRTRVLLVFSILVVILISLFTLVHAYFESVNLNQEYKQLSRQTANALSFMPALANALHENDVSEVQGIIDRVRLQAYNPLVSVIDDNGKEMLSGKEDETRHSLQATLVFGSYRTERTVLHGEEVIQTTAPIYDQIGDAEQLIGAVRVSYPLERINEVLYERLWRNAFVGFAGLALSLLCAGIISSSIQRDTFGHEPALIATLYKEREALLQSLNEGICAVNEHGDVTLFNPAAAFILGTEQANKGVLHKLGLFESLHNGQTLFDDMRNISGKSLVVNCQPLYENKKRVGAICSFRDFTEIKQVKETMAQMQAQSDGLRAQLMNFANKLYVLMGLLQLGKQEEALTFIVNETSVQRAQTVPLFQKITDVGVQALLLAKMAKAAEKHVHLSIEESSELHTIERIPISDLSTIIGNVLDNAIEAVADTEKKDVLFFASDAGDEWVIDVYDSGQGFNEDLKPLLQPGRSTKGEERGFGLSNVQQVLEKWNGVMEVNGISDKEGTVVSIYIPKTEGEKR